MPPIDAAEITPQWKPVDAPYVPVIRDDIRNVVNNNVSRGVPGKVENLLDKDAAGRNHNTFEAAVAGVSEATRGEKSSSWLELKLWDTLRATGDIDMIQKYRNISILTAALGENRLAEGTKYDRDKPAISFGKDLDLGGVAATSFLTAQLNLSSAEKYVAAHQGETINNKYFSPALVRELQTSREAVGERLDKIYGDHQILGKDGAFARFRAFLDNDEAAGAKFSAALGMSVDRSLRGSDPVFQAKMCRDAALCYLAATDRKMDRGDGGGAQSIFRKAVEHLEQAKKLDPNHGKGDVASLEIIVQQLKQRGLKTQ